MSFEEVIQFAKLVEEAGVDIMNSGIGWHEARVPTIATMVPRGAFAWITAKVRSEIKIPIIATNRINNRDKANEILAKGQADLISMARPFLADANILNKMAQDRDDEINTCIACNQACLDHVFANKIASCLVNPKACHEDEFLIGKVEKANIKKIGVIGAGPAGMSCAIEAAQRGHQVFIYEKNNQIGGQFNLAKEIPGKEEFNETLRYFKTMINELDIELNLNFTMTLDKLKDLNLDEYVFSTGIAPRIPKIEGIDHHKCISYQSLLSNRPLLGKSVAVIGSGGIGFDVAEFLTLKSNSDSTTLNLSEFLNEWGVDQSYGKRGAIKEKERHESFREIFLLQRKTSKPGKNLAKTTGWIHRQSLKNKGVIHLNGVEYLKVDDQGLHICQNGEIKVLNVDHVVICAGQISVNKLYEAAKSELDQNCHIIGGADLALEIDAKRAINQGVRLANTL